jgi:flagellar biogenesis protein FliO
MDLLDGLLKTGSALAIVLALVVLAALGARRWLVPVLGAAGARQSVRLVSSLALGGRRNVLVLDVQGRTLVVGATAQSLTLLTEFTEHHAATVPVAAPVMPDVGVVR